MDDNSIEKRAYEIWQRAGEPLGQSEHFWRLAREAILAEENPEPSLRDRLKGYGFHDIRSLGCVTKLCEA